MAVQAQFGGLAGWLPPCGGGGLADEQMQALLLSSAAANNKACQHHSFAPGVASAAQSELTCNGVVASRKRGRELEQYVSSSSAALLPIPGTDAGVQAVARRSFAVNANRTVTDSAAASTSGRAADAVVAELCQRQGAEVDALVRGECERLRAGIEQARKRQRQALVRGVAAAAARALREKETELAVARRRAVELEERLRQAAAESQAWCGLARSNEAVASGLRATLDALLLRAGGGGGAPAEEGCGESDPAAANAAADDALSRCFVEKEKAADDGVSSLPVSRNRSRWACRACGAGEATVLVLPCRHLCLCKACEPRADACPVCLAAKNASIHVAAV